MIPVSFYQNLAMALHDIGTGATELQQWASEQIPQVLECAADKTKKKRRKTILRFPRRLAYNIAIA